MAPRASILATEIEWLNSIKADLVVWKFLLPHSSLLSIINNFNPFV